MRVASLAPAMARVAWGWAVSLGTRACTRCSLGRDGRRGSEVVRVTDDDATALEDYPRTATDGPYAYPFWFGADADGDRAVAVWTDLRADAPGVYARTLRIH
jgi:hypothetical protein